MEGRARRRSLAARALLAAAAEVYTEALDAAGRRPGTCTHVHALRREGGAGPGWVACVSLAAGLVVALRPSAGAGRGRARGVRAAAARAVCAVPGAGGWPAGGHPAGAA